MKDFIVENSRHHPTAEIFFGEKTPHSEVPYFSGMEDVFNSKGKKLSSNYPLGSRVKNREYNKALDKALQDIAGFGAKYLVVSLGFDTYKDDPICDFSLTTDYYEEMARNIMSLKLPTVLIQEGGYRLDAIGANAASFVKGVTRSL